MTESNGVIQTPNYPSKYSPKLQCLWLVDFGMGMDVTITFKFFDVETQPECDYDYVTLHAGRNESAPQLGQQYCGKKIPKQRTVTGPVSILFKSDDDTEAEGFSLQYTTTGSF